MMLTIAVMWYIGRRKIQDRTKKEGEIKYDDCEVEVDGNKTTQKCDRALELYDGGIYEIKLFHAERQFGNSNFNFYLTGILPA